MKTHCFDAMDKLFARQGAIQAALAKKHLHDGTLVLYDITSCYMEGEYQDSELVEFGYNRDRKRGHEQIVISLLKDLIKVEQAFRNLKTTTLEIRPIYHKTDGRIKCHVFICMLSYYIMWHMRQRLQPFANIDGVGANRKYTFDYVIKKLKAVRSETIDVLGAQSSIVTTPDGEQEKILELLRVAI